MLQRRLGCWCTCVESNEGFRAVREWTVTDATISAATISAATVTAVTITVTAITTRTKEHLSNKCNRLDGILPTWHRRRRVRAA